MLTSYDQIMPEENGKFTLVISKPYEFHMISLSLTFQGEANKFIPTRRHRMAAKGLTLLEEPPAVISVAS